MITLQNTLSRLGTFILLEIDLQGYIQQEIFNNTQHNLEEIKNIKQIFGNREQEQISHDIYYEKTVESVLKTSKTFGLQTVRITTSKIENEKRYILINFAKTFEEQDDKQRKYIESLIKESEIDPMTEVLNRRGAWRRVEEILKRHAVTHIGVIFIDIDGLKKVNDLQGHLKGDEAIMQIANLLKDSTRKSDIVMRYGGDEFMIIVEERSSRRSASRGITRRILKTIRDEDFITTVSVGLHVVNTKNFLEGVKRKQDLEIKWNDELRKADEAVYKCKKQGRDTYNTTDDFKSYFDK